MSNCDEELVEEVILRVELLQIEERVKAGGHPCLDSACKSLLEVCCRGVTWKNKSLNAKLSKEQEQEKWVGPCHKRGNQDRTSQAAMHAALLLVEC